MKRLFIQILTAALIVAVTSCDFGTGSVSAPGASDYADDATSRNAADGLAAVFAVSTVTAVGLQNTTAQEFTIDLNNGIVDAASVAANVALYPVTDAATVPEAWVRGTAIGFTSTVTDNLDGSSRVTITFDGSSIITDTLELVVRGTLTANGTARRLNTDGDEVPGEAEDDDIRYLTIADTGVAGFTATTTGSNRDPQGVFSVALFEDDTLATPFDNLLDQATLPGALYFSFTADSGATAAAYEDFVVPTANTVQLYRVSGATLTAVPLTYAKLSAGVYSVTPQGGFTEGAFYLLRINALWTESTAWNGYSHRCNVAAWGGTNTSDQNAADLWGSEVLYVDSGDDGSTDFDGVNVTNADVTTEMVYSAGYVSGGYVEVDFSDDTNRVGNLIAASSAASLVQIVFDPDNTGGGINNDGDEQAVAVQSVVEAGPSVFRFVFGNLGKADADPFDLATGSNGALIMIYPGAFTDDQGTPSDTSDDTAYVDVDAGGVIEIEESVPALTIAME